MPLVHSPELTPEPRHRKVVTDPISLACARKAEKSAWKRSIEEQLQALHQELSVVNKDLEEVDRDIVTLQEDPRDNSANNTGTVLCPSNISESSISSSIRTGISI